MSATYWFYEDYSRGVHSGVSLGTAMRQGKAKHVQRLTDGRIIIGYKNRMTGVRRGLVPFDRATYVPDLVEKAKWDEMLEMQRIQRLRDEGDSWHPGD